MGLIPCRVPIFRDVEGDPRSFPKDKTWLTTREDRRYQERRAFPQRDMMLAGTTRKTRRVFTMKRHLFLTFEA
eukprot:5681319-Amphidinium_carterae.1